MDRATVFRFKLNDGESDGTLAPRAATAERILQISDAKLVPETALVVDRQCIDSQGFLINGYCPSGPR